MENLNIEPAEKKEADFSNQNDSKENRWQRRQFAETKVVELDSLLSKTPEQEEMLQDYKKAVKTIDEEIQNEEREYENLKPFRESINGVLRFSNPIKGWEALQTNDWVEISSNLKESIENHDLPSLMLGLEKLLRLSENNLDQPGFKETDLNGSLQRRAIKDIEKLMGVLKEYESKEISIPWDKI